MCGIAGAAGYIDDAVVAAVQAAHGQQPHRGPDADGFWLSPSAGDGKGVVLAHRRLSILDLSEAGAQPMHDAETGCVIAFNGEVYNFPEVRDELIALGRSFRSSSDTEVLLAAIATWGPQAAERFRGMFAYAVWDPRNRQLHIARDRLGIKPLYVAIVERPGGSTLLFASELRSMLATGLVERRLDPVALQTCLYNGFVVGPNTIVRGVKLLTEGHRATIDITEPQLESEAFWSPPQASPGSTSLADVEHELEEAVRMRLVADVPLGTFLSGGIDSSAVTALAAKVAPDGAGSINTFNVGFDEVDYDESKYAKAVADALGTNHTKLTLTQDFFRQHLDEALRSIDQPTFDGINTYFVSRAVREAGITVALAGTGGDELFGGYTSFADLPTARRWLTRGGAAGQALMGLLGPAVARRKAGPAYHGVPPQTRWGKLVDVIATRGDLPSLFQVSYALFTEAFCEQLRDASLDDATAQSSAVYGVPAEQWERLTAMSDPRHPLHSISNMELAQFIGQRLMRDTDWASMAVSLEVRVPLLDHGLIEAVAGLNDQDRFMPIRSKQFLRKTALRDLDPAIFDRPKSGFVLPIDRWVREDLKQTLDDTMHDAEACRAVGLNPAATASLWRAFSDGAPGIYWSRVWSLYVLIDWCRRHGLSLEGTASDIPAVMTA